MDEVYGQVPQTGLLASVKAELMTKLVGSDAILETHHPVKF